MRETTLDATGPDGNWRRRHSADGRDRRRLVHSVRYPHTNWTRFWGLHTAYTYDSANQLTAISYSDGVTPNVSGITYDADGQRTGMTDGTGTSSWGWDSLHRMVSYTNGNGAQVQWVYNLRNLPTTITYPGPLNAIRGYDNAGRWTSVQDWNSNTTSFGYDADSNLTTETFPAASGVVDTFTFNAADQMTSAASVKGGTTLFSAGYARDAANQLASDTSAAAANSAYKYTPLNQVCYAGSSSVTACTSPPTGSIPYTYDAADNLTKTGTVFQAFNNADELCWTASSSAACASPPSGKTTYTYDTRGNRTAVTPTTGQAQTLTYDQANRLTKFAAASTTSYGYNGDGLRMCKVAGSSTQPCQAGGNTQFLWDVAGSLPLLLKDGTTGYIYGPGGLPLEQVSGATTLWYHHDQLGSTRLVTNSTGVSQATYTYDPYGGLAASTGSITNPFRFCGQYQDLESGYYYLRARYYDPVTAQFLAADPAVGHTRAPYGYVSGNPLNQVDLAGLGLFPTPQQFFNDVYNAAKNVVTQASLNVVRADYEVLEIVSFVPYTAYWAAWEEQRHVVSNISQQVPFLAPFLLPTRAALWTCQRVGLWGDEAIDKLKDPLEQELGIGGEPTGDEGFVGNIGPHQTGPKTYLPGKHPNGDEDLAW